MPGLPIILWRSYKNQNVPMVRESVKPTIPKIIISVLNLSSLQLYCYKKKLWERCLWEPKGIQTGQLFKPFQHVVFPFDFGDGHTTVHSVLQCFNLLYQLKSFLTGVSHQGHCCTIQPGDSILSHEDNFRGFCQRKLRGDTT